MKRTIVLAALATGLAAGCSGPNLGPVSGVVTLDGRPLEGAHVTFQPIDGKEPGPGSRAVTGPDGRYILQTFDHHLEGGVVGKHQVMISKANGDENSAGELLPAKYNDDSQLTFVVPEGGTDRADFALSSK